MQTFALKMSTHNFNEVTRSSMNIVNFKGVTCAPRKTKQMTVKSLQTTSPC